MSQRFRSSRPNKARLLRPRSERAGRLSAPPSSAVVEASSPVSETISIVHPAEREEEESVQSSSEAQEAAEREGAAESATVSAPVDDALTDPPPPVQEARVEEAVAPVEPAAPAEVEAPPPAAVEAEVEAAIPPANLRSTFQGAGTPRELSAAIIPPPPEPVIQAAPEEELAASETPPPVQAEPSEASSVSPPAVAANSAAPASGKKKKKEKKGKKAKESKDSASPAAAKAAESAASRPSESTQKTLLAVSEAPAPTISEAPPRAVVSEPPEPEVEPRKHLDSLEPTARSVAPSMSDSSARHHALSDSSARHERAKGESGRHKLDDDLMSAEFFSVRPPEVDEPFEDLTPQRPPPSPAALQRQKMARKVVTGVVAVASLVVLIGVGRWLFGGRPADAQPTATPHGGANSHQLDVKTPEPPDTEPGPAVAPADVAREAAATATADPAPVAEASASAAEPAAASASASASAETSASASASASDSAVASASAAPSEDVKELRKKVMKLLDRGDNKGAIEAALAVLKQDETDSMMWLMLGTAYQSIGKMADAREAFNNCVRKGKGGHVGECAYFGGKK